MNGGGKADAEQKSLVNEKLEKKGRGNKRRKLEK